MKSKEIFMKDFLTAPFLRELCDTCANMYRLGWDERNAGNISLLLNESELVDYDLPAAGLRRFPLDFSAPALAGRCLLVTGTGQYFKNIPADPEKTLGLIRILPDGAAAELLWGWREGGAPTSELASHLMGHEARLLADPENRVILHSHPTHTVAMTRVHPLDEREFTRSLWKTCSECIMVFPRGLGLLPWMPFGGPAIGQATAQKLRRFPVVLWPLHGIYAAGRSLDEAFGLLEVIEKAAEIWLMTSAFPHRFELSDSQLRSLAEHLHLDLSPDFL